MNWYKHSLILYPPEKILTANNVFSIGSWYKKIVLAAMQAEIEADGMFTISGYTGHIYQQLKQFGFRGYMEEDPTTGKKSYKWKRDAESLRNDSDTLQVLQQLSIPNVNILMGPQAAPVQQTPVQQPIGSPWILATFLQGGEPVVAQPSQGGWMLQDRDGQQTPTPAGSIQTVVQRVTDEQGNPIQSTNPADLFATYDQMQTPAQKEEVKKVKSGQRPKPEDVRFPDEHLTPYNRAIRDKFLQIDASGNSPDVMINALAGTGKTSALKDLSSFIKPGEKWLYLVFNKKNQLEASSEFPEGVDVATTHSYLGSVLKNAGPDVGGSTKLPSMTDKGQKIYRILDQMLPRDTGRGRNRTYNTIYQQFRWKAVSRIKNIAELGKAFAVDPNIPDAIQQLADIVQKYNMDMDISTEKDGQDRDYTPDMLEHAKELLSYSLPDSLPQEYDRKDANLRDQDDTLWYAAIHSDQIAWNNNPHYDVVLMDEVQDFNQAQLIMAQKLQEAGARIVAVGDPNQAIYGWRGADSNAFGKLQNIVTDGEEDPAMSLPINFRSLPTIIDFVKENTHVKDLEAAPPEFWASQNIDPNSGRVDIEVDSNDFMGQMQQEYTTGDRHLQQETAIISRTNAPLVEHALSLLRNDIDFQILGRDLSKELTDHIKKVTYFRPEMKSIADLGYDLNNYVNNLQEEWSGKVSKQDELKDIEGTTEALMAVLGHVSEPGFEQRPDGKRMNNARDFLSYIEDKLRGQDPDNASDYAKLKSQKEADPTAMVTLTTAHKSKGMEYERVFVLEPGAFNPEGAQIRTEAEAQQERNAWYVSLTRAQKHLIIGTDKKEES